MKIKNFKNYLFVAFAGILFYSCEYEKLNTYSGDDQIYFSFAGQTTSIIDSSYIKFGYDIVIKSDSVISIPVKVQGLLSEADRPVKFALAESLSSAALGSDIDLLLDESFIPAGKETGNIKVKIKNTAKLDGTVLKAVLELQENEFFKVNYLAILDKTIDAEKSKIATQYKVYFDNANEMPNMWAYYTSRYEMFFGVYSKKKFDILCTLFGFDREYFTYYPDESPSTIFAQRFELGLLQAWARGFNIYLRTQKENGNTVYEEDGTEMTGSPYSAYQ